MLLEAFKRLLEADYDIVGTAIDGRTLVSLALELTPDAIVADISMPELNGLEAARQVLERLPRTRVILLTVHEDEALAADSFRAGVAGYVVKRSAASELNQALERTLDGGTFLTPLVADGDVETLRLERSAASPTTLLTPREREVLQLLAEGLSMKEVGARLDITARTVAYHKYQMIGKLGLRTSADLVRFAVEHRIVGQPPLPGNEP